MLKICVFSAVIATSCGVPEIISSSVISVRANTSLCMVYSVPASVTNVMMSL